MPTGKEFLRAVSILSVALGASGCAPTAKAIEPLLHGTSTPTEIPATPTALPTIPPDSPPDCQLPSHVKETDDPFAWKSWDGHEIDLGTGTNGERITILRQGNHLVMRKISPDGESESDPAGSVPKLQDYDFYYASAPTTDGRYEEVIGVDIYNCGGSFSIVPIHFFLPTFFEPEPPLPTPTAPQA